MLHFYIASVVITNWPHTLSETIHLPSYKYNCSPLSTLDEERIYAMSLTPLVVHRVFSPFCLFLVCLS